MTFNHGPTETEFDERATLPRPYMSETRREPTARPWKGDKMLRIMSPEHGRRQPGIGQSRALICRVNGGNVAGGDGDANAELIIRAVNAHDDLVAALRRVLGGFVPDPRSANHVWASMSDDAYAAARAALDQAKGGAE
jgi:hypothetical protein